MDLLETNLFNILSIIIYGTSLKLNSVLVTSKASYIFVVGNNKCEYNYIEVKNQIVWMVLVSRH